MIYGLYDLWLGRQSYHDIDLVIVTYIITYIYWPLGYTLEKKNGETR